jgi:hypothetical protein
MARLTTFSRLLITIAIVVGVFFAVRTFLPGIAGSIGKKTDNTETTTSGSGGDAATGNHTATEEGKSNTWGTGGSAESTPATSANNGGVSFNPTPFNYTAPVPSGGKLRAVVELGATGFNYFVVRIDAQKNWKMEKDVFGVSLVKEGLATDEDIKSGLRKYIGEILDYGVGPRDIHFVISSGAKKSDVIDKIIGELKKMNYVVNTVTAEQEAKLALRAAMTRDYQSSAFVADIGSGNTKIAWYNGSAPSGLEGYGSKYFQDNITDAVAFSDTKAKASRVPAGLRSTCFIIGGVPFEFANQHRNGKERYTLLKAPAAYTANGNKQKAGLNIYAAIAEGTGCKQFVFDWNANFTIGFLLNL